jgi:hypothetical protein
MKDGMWRGSYSNGLSVVSKHCREIGGLSVRTVCGVCISLQWSVTYIVLAKKPLDDRRRTRPRGGNQNNSNVRSLDLAVHSADDRLK